MQSFVNFVILIALTSILTIQVLLLIPTLAINKNANTDISDLCNNTYKTLMETAKVMQFNHIVHLHSNEPEETHTNQYLKVAIQYTLMQCPAVYIPLFEFEKQAYACLQKLEQNTTVKCDTTNWNNM